MPSMRFLFTWSEVHGVSFRPVCSPPGSVLLSICRSRKTNRHDACSADRRFRSLVRSIVPILSRWRQRVGMPPEHHSLGDLGQASGKQRKWDLSQESGPCDDVPSL
jgi:hypothetical protein